jgi:hypothetical protein
MYSSFVGASGGAIVSVNMYSTTVSSRSFVVARKQGIEGERG